VAAQNTYTRRFGATHQAAAGTVTLFTADALHTYVLRDLALGNQSSLEGLLNVYLTEPGSFFTVLVATVPAATSVHWEGRQQILSGESLVANASVGPWSCLATGFELG
jgi:hypothetical protein